MLEVDPDLIKCFETTMDPAHPEEGSVRAKVIGYGEMSTILGFDEPGYDHLVFKRMALFADDIEVREYETIFRAYNEALRDLKLRVPDWGILKLDTEWGPVLYLLQAKLDPEAVGHKLIHTASQDDSLTLIQAVLGEVRKVWTHNASLHDGNGAEIGLDAQISNWAVAADGGGPWYFDTSTPLMRIDGVEQLDAELFLRICPRSMQWVIRRYFLQDVLDRYYILRLVLTDLLANLYKEQKGTLVPPALEMVNEFLSEVGPGSGAGTAGSESGSGTAGVDLEPIEAKAVLSYYRQDMPIWWLFLNMRRAERVWRTRVRRQQYRPILPGRVRRFHLRSDRG